MKRVAIIAARFFMLSLAGRKSEVALLMSQWAFSAARSITGIARIEVLQGAAADDVICSGILRGLGEDDALFGTIGSTNSGRHFIS